MIFAVNTEKVTMTLSCPFDKEGIGGASVVKRISGQIHRPERVNKGTEKNAERWQEHSEKPTFPKHIYKERQRV